MERRSLGPVPVLTIVALLLGSQIVSALPDGRIGVLYIGEPFAPPFYLMIPDPLFPISFVDAHVHASGPLDTRQVHRTVRIYMPRTVGSLVSSYDVVVLFCATRDAVGTKYIEMISEAMVEGGVGLFMSGSQEGFGGFQAKPSWGGTSVGDLLPVEVYPDGRGLYGKPVFDDPGHELVSSIPWNMKHPTLANPGTWRHNLVTLKPGANRLAHSVWQGVEDPLMVTWEVVAGARVFALTSEIHALSQGLRPWDYHYDLPCNIMIYLDNRPVPQDIEVVHRARSKILEVSQRRSLLVDLLEFSEAFGADTGGILSEIEEVDVVISQAYDEYLNLRYAEMLERSEPIDSMIEELERKAVELKNRALMWIYVIEWLTVTATALLCGFVLWTVMVKRKLYREVQVTRLR